MRVSTFIFILTGSFAVWATKGFKGSFNNAMVSIEQRNSTKGNIRYFLGLGIWILILVIAGVILSRPTKPQSYEGRMNEKGEIELRPID